jgi:CHAT domain-containing protein/Tfp pilus assembly protein PilF
MMKSIANQPFNICRTLVVILMTVFSLSSLAQASDQQTNQAKPEPKSEEKQSEIRKLEVGKSIERELKGGESHSYEIALEAGKFLNAVVEQRGIDVVVQVLAPDGKQLMEVDSPNGDQGPEPVPLITEAAGVYRLNVNSPDNKAPIGRYEIRVKELRAATEGDRALIEKNRVLQEARKLADEAESLRVKGKYDAALPLAERALAIREKTLGAEPLDTAESLNNLAVLYHSKGDYAKAETLYVRALAIDEKVLGVEHSLTANSLNNLALLYKSTGDYAKAEPLFIRALAIREKTLGAEHPNTATSLSTLANLYSSKGDYAKAEPLFIRALAIRQKVLGGEHPDTAESLNNLALLYNSKGDYAKAEPLFIRALAICTKALGAEHPSTATSLNNLAYLYSSKGDYGKAEPLYIRALVIYEKALGAEHPSTASSLNNLAELYLAKGDYVKAEPLYIRALTIREKALGAEHPSTAISLNNLAALYRTKGDYTKAEPLYVRALLINEKALGADHPTTATSFNNLAGLYKEKGDYAKAEPLYIRALAIYEKVLGAEHPYAANSLNNLAVLYESKGDYAKAVDFQSRCNDVSDRDLLRNLASGSERQKLAYLNRTSLYTDSTISLHVQFLPNEMNAKRAALKVLLQRKGRGFDAMTDAIGALRRRLSPEDQQLLNQLQDVRSQLSVLTLHGAGRDGLEKHKANLKALEEQEEKLQNDISQRSAQFRAQSQMRSKPVTIEVIQKAIPPAMTLIEFAQYRPSDPKETMLEKRFGKPRYVAYVLPSQGESLSVELGDAESINKKIDALRKGLRDKRHQDVKRLARAVDREVMQPVRKLLGHTRRVFISPDSALNLIPFAALVDERGEYLVKQYHFTYLTSGRDLLRLQEKTKSKSAPIVMADADFDDSSNSDKARDTTTASQTRDVNAATDATNATNASDQQLGPKLGELEFEPLKRLVGSADEARVVKKTLNQATVFLRGDATESALKQVSGPSILHIATHGYFLEEEVKAGAKTSGSTRIAVRRRSNDSTASVKLENPALRSGLFFAGANKGKSGDDDGVLTALEAAGLDLWGTKIVVLSACDTGVGEVLNGQGVQGLRRALVLAGSESQMMSLWPVSDTGTRELMIEYYRRLKAGEGRGEALRQVQLKMLTNPKRRHPFYWASFIQSGEWASLDGKR